MNNLSLNCLPEGESLRDLVWRNCAIGFDLRFCRSVAVTPDDRDTITCDPTEAKFATLYALIDLGEAITIHGDPPDAAQRQKAEQVALTEPDRIV